MRHFSCHTYSRCTLSRCALRLLCSEICHLCPRGADEILWREPDLAAEFSRADIKEIQFFRRRIDDDRKNLLHADGCTAAAHVAGQRREFF